MSDDKSRDAVWWLEGCAGCAKVSRSSDPGLMCAIHGTRAPAAQQAPAEKKRHHTWGADNRCTATGCAATRALSGMAYMHTDGAGRQSRKASACPSAPGFGLRCYCIEDSGTHYVAAATPLGALRVLADLEMYDDATAYSISVECVPDEKADDTRKIEQSEDAAKPDGYTLREALAKARAEGKPQLLSTSEF